MACDCEIPCRECKEGGSEYCTDPAECGHAVLPSSDNLLERAFMARIRADEYREKLAKLREEFESRPEVMGLKLSIERCEEERRTCIEQAKAAGISKQGSFRLKIRTRKQRTVIPKLFFAKHGAEAFVECATIAIGKAEALLGKAALDDCCEVEVKETGVSVEYVRPEGSE
jgi:hypothetical protein